MLPILILSLIFGVTSIRQSSLLEEHKFSWNLYFLLAASFTCFILASSFAGNLGWTDFLVIFLFAASAIFLFAFCKKSLQSSEPLIHLEVFKNFHFSLSVLGLLLLQFICLGIGFFIPNFANSFGRRSFRSRLHTFAGMFSWSFACACQRKTFR